MAKAKRRTAKKAAGDGDMVSVLRSAFGDIPVVSEEEAAANLARGQEEYALGSLLRWQIDEWEATARECLEGAKNATHLPADVRHWVQATASGLLFQLGRLRQHLVHREIGQAVLAGVKIGDGLQMIVRHCHEPVLVRENNRCSAHRENAVRRKSTAVQRRKMARDLYAEYDPADLKHRGKGAVWREIGEIMASRLFLPEPIPGDTVRKYLAR